MIVLIEMHLAQRRRGNSTELKASKDAQVSSPTINHGRRNSHTDP